jgi:hypothetical protein
MSLHVQRYGDRTISRDLPVLPQCQRGDTDLRKYAGLIPFLKEMRELTVAERDDMPDMIGAAMWRLSNGLGLCLSARSANLELSIAFKDRTLNLATPDPFLTSTSNRHPDAGLATSLIGCIDLALLLLEAGQAEPKELDLLQEEFERRRDAIALHVKSLNTEEINSVTVRPPSPVSDALQVSVSSQVREQYAYAEIQPEHAGWMPLRIAPYSCAMTDSELKLSLAAYPTDVVVDFKQDPVSMLRMYARAQFVELSAAPPLIIPEEEWECIW